MREGHSNGSTQPACLHRASFHLKVRKAHKRFFFFSFFFPCVKYNQYQNEKKIIIIIIAVAISYTLGHIGDQPNH